MQLAAGGSALRVIGLVPWESPLYKAGVAQDDQLVNLDGTALTSMANYDQALGAAQAWRSACRCVSCGEAVKR